MRNTPSKTEHESETVKGKKGKNQINLGSHPTNMSPLRKEKREGRILLKR